MGGMDPNTSSHLLWICRCICSKLDWKLSSQDLHQCSHIGCQLLERQLNLLHHHNSLSQCFVSINSFIPVLIFKTHSTVSVFVPVMGPGSEKLMMLLMGAGVAEV